MQVSKLRIKFGMIMDSAMKQQDRNAAKVALKQANNTCRNCHRQYRSRW